MTMSVVLPVIIPDDYCLWLTRLCIAALHSHAKHAFELVVVETGTRHLDPERGGPFPSLMAIDRYVHREQITSYVADWNAGADAASGELLVHIGNDVLVGPRWDEALRAPFERLRDCGMSSTSVVEPGFPPIGHSAPVEAIVEGWMTAFCCFRREWRLDPAYESWYSDTDLLMRIYASGRRAYRNMRHVATHLHQVTYKRVFEGTGQRTTDAGEAEFYRRWTGSPWWVYGMVRTGRIEWGREHVGMLLAPPSTGNTK